MRKIINLCLSNSNELDSLLDKCSELSNCLTNAISTQINPSLFKNHKKVTRNMKLNTWVPAMPYTVWGNSVRTNPNESWTISKLSTAKFKKRKIIEFQSWTIISFWNHNWNKCTSNRANQYWRHGDNYMQRDRIGALRPLLIYQLQVAIP